MILEILKGHNKLKSYIDEKAGEINPWAWIQIQSEFDWKSIKHLDSGLRKHVADMWNEDTETIMKKKSKGTLEFAKQDEILESIRLWNLCDDR
jgi:hypothetical protein